MARSREGRPPHQDGETPRQPKHPGGEYKKRSRPEKTLDSGQPRLATAHDVMALTKAERAALPDSAYEQSLQKLIAEQGQVRNPRSRGQLQARIQEMQNERPAAIPAESPTVSPKPAPETAIPPVEPSPEPVLTSTPVPEAQPAGQPAETTGSGDITEDELRKILGDDYDAVVAKANEPEPTAAPAPTRFDAPPTTPKAKSNEVDISEDELRKILGDDYDEVMGIKPAKVDVPVAPDADKIAEPTPDTTPPLADLGGTTDTPTPRPVERRSLKDWGKPNLNSVAEVWGLSPEDLAQLSPAELATARQTLNTKLESYHGQNKPVVQQVEDQLRRIDQQISGEAAVPTDQEPAPTATGVSVRPEVTPDTIPNPEFSAEERAFLAEYPRILFDANDDELGRTGDQLDLQTRQLLDDIDATADPEEQAKLRHNLSFIRARRDMVSRNIITRRDRASGTTPSETDTARTNPDATPPATTPDVTPVTPADTEGTTGAADAPPPIPTATPETGPVEPPNPEREQINKIQQLIEIVTGDLPAEQLQADTDTMKAIREWQEKVDRGETATVDNFTTLWAITTIANNRLGRLDDISSNDARSTELATALNEAYRGFAAKGGMYQFTSGDAGVITSIARHLSADAAFDTYSFQKERLDSRGYGVGEGAERRPSSDIIAEEVTKDLKDTIEEKLQLKSVKKARKKGGLPEFTPPDATAGFEASLRYQVDYLNRIRSIVRGEAPPPRRETEPATPLSPLEQARANAAQALMKRGQIFGRMSDKELNKHIGEYQDAIAADQNAKLEQIKHEFAGRDLTKPDVAQALQARLVAFTLSERFAEDTALREAMKTSGERTAGNKFKEFWRKNSGKRLLIGLGLAGVGFATGGIAIPAVLAGTVLGARVGMSSVGTTMMAEGGIQAVMDKYGKTTKLSAAQIGGMDQAQIREYLSAHITRYGERGQNKFGTHTTRIPFKQWSDNTGEMLLNQYQANEQKQILAYLTEHAGEAPDTLIAGLMRVSLDEQNRLHGLFADNRTANRKKAIIKWGISLVAGAAMGASVAISGLDRMHAKAAKAAAQSALENANQNTPSPDLTNGAGAAGKAGSAAIETGRHTGETGAGATTGVEAGTGTAIETGGHVVPVAETGAGATVEATRQAAERAASFKEVAHKGDSVWKLLTDQLHKRLGDNFDQLDPARKTYIIDSIKDQMAAHPQEFGLTDINHIDVNQTIDFTAAFEGPNAVNLPDVVTQAKELSQTAVDSITHNQEVIGQWISGHPGEPINDTIINHLIHGTSTAATDAASQTAEFLGANHEQVSTALVNQMTRDDIRQSIISMKIDPALYARFHAMYPDCYPAVAGVTTETAGTVADTTAGGIELTTSNLNALEKGMRVLEALPKTPESREALHKIGEMTISNAVKPDSVGLALEKAGVDRGVAHDTERHLITVFKHLLITADADTKVKGLGLFLKLK